MSNSTKNSNVRDSWTSKQRAAADSLTAAIIRAKTQGFSIRIWPEGEVVLQLDGGESHVVWKPEKKRKRRKSKGG